LVYVFRLTVALLVTVAYDVKRLTKPVAQPQPFNVFRYGLNLLPYLSRYGLGLRRDKSGEKNTPPHDSLFWRMGQNHAVRCGNFKLVKNNKQTSLFDLSSDIGESRDLSPERPDVLKEMQQAFQQWSSQMIEPLWTR